MGIELLIKHLETLESTDNTLLDNADLKCLKELKVKPSLVTKINEGHQIYSGVKIGQNTFFPLVIIDQKNVIYFIDGAKLNNDKFFRYVRQGIRKRLISNYRIFSEKHFAIMDGIDAKLYTCILNNGLYNIDEVEIN